MTPAKSFAEMSFDFLSGGGEMADRIRRFDWSSHPLGAFEAWPQALKTITSLILNSPQPMWIGWGPEMSVLYNDACLQLLGDMRHPWALGRPAFEVWSEIWRDGGPIWDKVFCEGHGSFIDDVRLLVNRGTVVEETYYSFSFSPIRNEPGRIVGIFCVSNDVTAKVLSAARLQALSKLSSDDVRSSLLLGAIVDSSNDAIISKDLNGVITSWNRSAERLFGYSAEEAIGQTVAALLIPEDRQDEEPDILHRLRRGERVDHFETVRRRKDGTLIDISLIISPVKDDLGRIAGASKIAHDITASKQAELALRRSEERFRELAEVGPQIIWLSDHDGALEFVNNRWVEYSGLDLEATRDLAQILPRLHSDDHLLEHWRRAISTGSPFELEARLRGKDGEFRWFMMRSVPVKDDQGRILRWFGASTDIHENKLLQLELRRANQDLEQFAYSASHDLQEPLRAIKIFSELLSERHAGKLDGQGLEFLGNVRENAGRMETLIRDLLAYTHAAKIERPSHPVDANTALQAAIATLTVAITESGASVSCVPLPAVRVHTTQMQQLFQNLIGNAIKYRRPGVSPVVEITVRQENSNWTFAVADNGIGIEPEYKERIFGLFKRLHSGTEYPGTGIGLALCQRIVEQNQGRIWVESQPGKGSAFYFTIPL